MPIQSKIPGLNELIMSFHAGQPIMAWIFLDIDSIKEKMKQANQQGGTLQGWGCMLCGHESDCSMVMTSPTTVACESCYDDMNRLFPTF